MLGFDTKIADLPDEVDRSAMWVYAPTQVIFVCGGVVNLPPPAKPINFRDAYMRVAHSGKLAGYETRLAEDVLPFYPLGRYRDILRFESDIAQISELILLFTESPGSFTELGAFALEPEISARTLAVITRHFFDQQSFIRLGPIQALLNTHGRASVYVLEDDRLQIGRHGDLKDLLLPEFAEGMTDAVSGRLSAVREPTTFNADRHGHLIKFITGLIQHYGALTQEEISELLLRFEIELDQDSLINFLLCSNFMGWTKEDSRGLRTFFAARDVEPALSFNLLPGHHRNRDRWLADIREYWRDNQAERFRSITAAMAS